MVIHSTSDRPPRKAIVPDKTHYTKTPTGMYVLVANGIKSRDFWNPAFQVQGTQ